MNSFNQRPDNKPLLNIEEVMALTTIKRGTLYKLTSQKRIPHYKVGKKIVFKTTEVLEYIDRFKVEPLSPIGNGYSDLNPLKP